MVMGAQYLVCILFFHKKSLDLCCIWKIKGHQVVLLSLNLNKNWYVEAYIYFIIDKYVFLNYLNLMDCH